MVYLARNISGKFAMLLKHQLPPNGTLDLEAVFEGFCKPKKVARSEPPRNPEYTRDQFSDFLEMVRSKADPREWSLEFDGVPTSINRDRGSVTPGGTLRKKRNILAVKKAAKKTDASELTAKQIALLPHNDSSKQTIASCSDVRKLKAAVKMARNLAGQERIRGLLEDRVQELAAEGVV